MSNVLLRPSGVSNSCICINSKNFVIKTIFLLVYITNQINMLPKLRFAFHTVLIQGFNLKVLIKVIEHQVLGRILALFKVAVVTETFAGPSACAAGYWLAT